MSEGLNIITCWLWRGEAGFCHPQTYVTHSRLYGYSPANHMGYSVGIASYSYTAGYSKLECPW